MSGLDGLDHPGCGLDQSAYVVSTSSTTRRAGSTGSNGRVVVSTGSTHRRAGSTTWGRSVGGWGDGGLAGDGVLERRYVAGGVGRVRGVVEAGRIGGRTWLC